MQRPRAIENTPHACLLAVLVLLALVPAAHAQFFYSPPPPLMGQPSFHLYSVPGVVSIGGLATFFACTNTTSGSIRVGVEVFGGLGGTAANDASAASLDINPGGTLRFATGPAAGFGFSGDLAAGGVNAGSARILATKRSGIICSAFIAEDSNAPPTSMTELKVVKKKTQKGD